MASRFFWTGWSPRQLFLLRFAIALGCWFLLMALIWAVVTWRIVAGLSINLSVLEIPWWAYLAFFVLLFTAGLMWQSRAWRKAKHLHGPQVVNVTESGLRFITPAGSLWFGWAAIQRVHRVRNLFALYMRDGTLRLIPKN